MRQGRSLAMGGVLFIQKNYNGKKSSLTTWSLRRQRLSMRPGRSLAMGGIIFLIKKIVMQEVAPDDVCEINESKIHP